MTSNDKPEIEITDEIRQLFSSYIQNKNRSIRRLRYCLWWIRGCGGVVVAIFTYIILASGIVEFLPGGGLSIAILTGQERGLLAFLGAAVIELCFAVKCSKCLKGEQMDLKKAKDCGFQHGLTAD